MHPYTLLIPLTVQLEYLLLPTGKDTHMLTGCERDESEIAQKDEPYRGDAAYRDPRKPLLEILADFNQPFHHLSSASNVPLAPPVFG